jgi:small subunit ribosomal protein S20
MAHSLSAKKRIRQNAKRNLRNRSRRATLKTQLKDTVEQLLHGSAEQLKRSTAESIQALDKAGSRRTIHKNAAARRKSRLMKKLNAKVAGAK